MLFNDNIGGGILRFNFRFYFPYSPSNKGYLPFGGKIRVLIGCRTLFMSVNNCNSFFKKISP